MIPYVATTEDVRVVVRPAYLDAQSAPLEHRFVFSYLIRIENHSTQTVQLLRRAWYIVDQSGFIQQVEGEGVVGQQPIVHPGRAHEYSSFVVIRAFSGYMEGSYLMQRDDGSRFSIQIPRFYLQAAAN